MEFLLVVPFNPSITKILPVDEEILNDPSSLTYPAKNATLIKNGAISIWMYSRDSKVPTNEPIINERGVFLTKGTAIVNKAGILNSEETYNHLRENKNQVQGDFLLLGVENDGGGEIFSTTMTFCPLFVHKGKNHTVLSTDLGLLNKCLVSRREKGIVKFYDPDYIFESIENEWGTRVFPEKTMFSDISRALTTTKYWFEDFELCSKSIQYELFRKDLEEMYLESKDLFYDHCFGLIEDSIRAVFKEMKGANIELLMSGGLDSRLSTVLVSHVSNDYDISLSATLFGPEDHPDVVIGKQVTDLMNIPSQNKTGDGKIWMPRSKDDYRKGMLVSWGDWSSNNWRTSKIFQERLVISGQDNYKRHNWAKIFSMNRWYAARMSYTATIPILSHQIINDMILIYGKHDFHKATFEFAYELMKRYNPDLLNVPLVGMEIPQHPVPAYSSVKASKMMPSIDAEAYFDVDLAISLLAELEFHAERKVTIESILQDKRKRRIIMDFTSLTQ